MDTVIVRAAMSEGIDYVPQLTGVRPGAVAHDIPGYAAHGMEPIT
ncbi:hypothetical protein [Candidatus Thiosymbion oneisti]|nr:hypothetical protein [Candidatus Thiosymbion oneisti]